MKLQEPRKASGARKGDVENLEDKMIEFRTEGVQRKKECDDLEENMWKVWSAKMETFFKSEENARMRSCRHERRNQRKQNRQKLHRKQCSQHRRVSDSGTFVRPPPLWTRRANWVPRKLRRDCQVGTQGQRNSWQPNTHARAKVTRMKVGSSIRSGDTSVCTI